MLSLILRKTSDTYSTHGEPTKTHFISPCLSFLRSLSLLIYFPGRWQEVLNAIFPPNSFTITNMAMSGSASDISASIMEYNIWPKDHPDPDVILWDHAISELVQYDESVVYEHIQMFQDASRNVQFCRDDLPLVAYVDSTPAVFEQEMAPIFSQMYVTNAIHATASWHNTMAISYVNVVRPYIYSHVKETEMEKSLLGVKDLGRHLGLMFHVTTAWVVIFNWLLALSETCLLEKVAPKRPLDGHTPDTNKPQTLSNIIPNAVDNNELPMKDIPAINNSTLQYWQVQHDWETRTRTRREACAATSGGGSMTTDLASYNPMVCSYLWLVNRATAVFTKQHVAANIRLFMTQNDGWEAQGFPIRSPRPGWIATKQNATFVMEYPHQQHLKSLTLISMLSYAREWVNSTLQVTIELLSNNSTSSNFTGMEDVNNRRWRTVRHHVTGYHKERSSILVTHKLRLPEGVIQVGDVLRVEMKLVGGETFKISGMGLCPV
jgi:hypothetical protein